MISLAVSIPGTRTRCEIKLALGSRGYCDIIDAESLKLQGMINGQATETQSLFGNLGLSSVDVCAAPDETPARLSQLRSKKEVSVQQIPRQKPVPNRH